MRTAWLIIQHVLGYALGLVFILVLIVLANGNLTGWPFT